MTMIEEQNIETEQEVNRLFPVFLKLEQLRLLIVGGGSVALEKLIAVLANSPRTEITLVSISISDDIRKLALLHSNVKLVEREFYSEDVETSDLVISAVNSQTVSESIFKIAKQKGKLLNSADLPELCDFYLGSIVRKGNLKIAISTNGKSPTIAKRLKEEIGGMIPDEMEEVLDNMQTIRHSLNGDFSEKVRQLNDLTKVLVAHQAIPHPSILHKPVDKKWQQIVKSCLFAFVFMILGHAVLSWAPFGELLGFVRTLPKHVDTNAFLIMMLTGFVAQMVDGSMGLGYGTISTTFLLAYGVSPAIVSSRVH